MNLTTTRIDEKEYSSYNQYAGENNSSGRLLHYLSVICGLRVAESVQLHSGGKIFLHNEKIGEYNMDKGFPYFKFAEERFNDEQHYLLIERYEFTREEFAKLDDENKGKIPIVYVVSRNAEMMGVTTFFPNQEDFNASHNSIKEACTQIYELTGAKEICIVYEGE